MIKSYYLKEKTKKLKTKKAKESVEYEYDHSEFRDYLSDMIKAQNHDYKIIPKTLPCCSYEDNDNWIIGIEIGHIGIYDLTPFNPQILSDLDKYTNCLKDMLHKLKLHRCYSDNPKVYFMADDCMNCT